MDPKLVTKQHPVHVWDDEKHHHSASNYVIPQQITSSHSKLRHPTANYVIPQQIASSHSKLRHPSGGWDPCSCAITIYPRNYFKLLCNLYTISNASRAVKLSGFSVFKCSKASASCSVSRDNVSVTIASSFSIGMLNKSN